GVSRLSVSVEADARRRHEHGASRAARHRREHRSLEAQRAERAQLAREAEADRGRAGEHHRRAGLYGHASVAAPTVRLGEIGSSCYWFTESSSGSSAVSLSDSRICRTCADSLFQAPLRPQRCRATELALRVPLATSCRYWAAA